MRVHQEVMTVSHSAGANQRGQFGRDGPPRGRYQDPPGRGSALVGGSALLGSPIPSGGSALLGPAPGGLPQDVPAPQPVESAPEDEDDSAAFNAELDRIAAEKEQVCPSLTIANRLEQSSASISVAFIWYELGAACYR